MSSTTTTTTPTQPAKPSVGYGPWSYYLPKDTEGSGDYGPVGIHFPPNANMRAVMSTLGHH